MKKYILASLAMFFSASAKSMHNHLMNTKGFYGLRFMG